VFDDPLFGGLGYETGTVQNTNSWIVTKIGFLQRCILLFYKQIKAHTSSCPIEPYPTFLCRAMAAPQVLVLGEMAQDRIHKQTHLSLPSKDIHRSNEPLQAAPRWRMRLLRPLRPHINQTAVSEEIPLSPRDKSLMNNAISQHQGKGLDQIDASARSAVNL
jgi:hypothetical protein